MKINDILNNKLNEENSEFFDEDGMLVIYTIESEDDLSEPLADMLGIPDGWKLTKIGKTHAAYMSGDRLVFFSDPSLFEPLDDDFEIMTDKE